MQKLLMDTAWLSPYIHASCLLLGGGLFMWIVRHALNKIILTHLKQPNLLPLNQFLSWFIFIIFAMMSLKQLGFELSLALQAAGFLTVALGFGFQNIASNFVCGLFLLSDKNFKLGDKVEVNSLTGKIKKLQLLSISLIDDNKQIIRVPNDLFFKSTVLNLSHCQSFQQPFEVTLYACSLDFNQLTQLINHDLPKNITIQCQLTQIDSHTNSITLLCYYSCDPKNTHRMLNTLLEQTARQLTRANMQFQLNAKTF